MVFSSNKTIITHKYFTVSHRYRCELCNVPRNENLCSPTELPSWTNFLSRIGLSPNGPVDVSCVNEFVIDVS